MSPLYVYTLFDSKTGKPRCSGIKDGDRIVTFDLFKGKGSGNPLLQIYEKINRFRKILTKSEHSRQIVISDYKKHIEAFDLKITNRKLQIYDLALPEITTSKGIKDSKLVSAVLEKMAKQKHLPHHNILANVSVAYRDVELRGLEINYYPSFPKWSLKTFSGRSKTSGVNIQGWSENDMIRPPGFSDNDLLIHFDWICADIRVASILSKDKKLQNSFVRSDPYQVVMDEINNNGDGDNKLSRDECKSLLLKSINSMDFTGEVLTDIYSDLGKWIKRSKDIIQADDGFLETILHKKFKLAHSKNELSVLNGAMQGSVAHAMQNTFRKVWEKIPGRIITEIHDSIVVCCSPNRSDIKSTIDLVSDIMFHPFQDILESNPAFPLKISVGRKWKDWKTVMVRRESGIQYVKKEKKQKAEQNSLKQIEEKEEKATKTG